MKEVFDVDVWCDIKDSDGISAKVLDEIIHQLKDLSAHCEVSDILGLRQFRIDDKTELLSEDEDDYDESTLVTGQVNVYCATFSIANAREFVWDARETFEAFGLSEVHYTICG